MIKVEQLAVEAGAFHLVDISLEVPTGSYAVLMGKTGCGKTTLLEAVCGLKVVTAGRIELMGEDVTNLRAGERGIGYVPQDVALFSTMTVREHLAFGPRVHRWGRAEIDATVEELAAELDIAPLLGRRPNGLSGGERQRVALGRALSIRPRVLCLDEPLSALDEDTHAEICDLLLRTARAHGVTVLHVTHSRAEAARLADLGLRLEGGKIAAVELSL